MASELADALSLARHVKPVVCRTARLIHGMPTVGKSFIQKSLTRRGARVYDTDLMLKSVIPDHFEWLRASRSSPSFTQSKEFLDYMSTVDLLMGRACGETISKYTDAVVFTHLWGPQFRTGFHESAPSDQSGGEGDTRLPLSVGRSDPTTVLTLMSSRGREVVTAQVAESWCLHWLSDAKSAFRVFIDLSPVGSDSDDPLYLSDVIRFRWPFLDEFAYSLSVNEDDSDAPFTPQEHELVISDTVDPDKSVTQRWTLSGSKASTWHTAEMSSVRRSRRTLRLSPPLPVRPDIR